MRVLSALYRLLAAVISLLIGVAALQYVTPDFNTGFLYLKEDIFSYYRYFFYAHIIGGPIAFLSGLFQVSFPRNFLHRYIGKLYMVMVIGLAAPGGFFMAFYAIGGLVNTINFMAMAGLWMWFTLQAFRHIKNGRLLQHQQWMTRSFIMANSAILIRLFSFVNNHYQVMDLTIGYVIISFASWLPWLLIYEIRLRTKNVNFLLK